MTAHAGKPLEERIKRRVRREVNLIERALADRRHLHRSVHEARKAIRRLRALLALVEERLPAVTAADGELQRLGDSLSRLRDAQVTLGTAQGLVRDAVPSDAVLGWLRLRRDALVERVLRRDPDFVRRRSLLRACRRALHVVEWDQVEVDDLHGALRKSNRRVMKAEHKAMKDPTPEHLHRWRRRLRRMRMQLEIVRALAPDAVRDGHDMIDGKPVRVLHKQSDRLGKRQDLEHLDAVLRCMPMNFERELLLHEIKRQLQKKLQ